MFVRSPPLQPSAPAPQRIIAFTGLAGSGKSTAAARLMERHGFARVRFAGPLKAMMAALGLAPEQIDGDEKETPTDLLCGRTPRHAMQTIGTEWGRNCIGENLWINAWNATRGRVPVGVPVVVDDCRFPNEATAIRAAGGLIVRIERPGAGSASGAGHSSEGQALPADLIIQNDQSLGHLHGTIDALARDVSWAWAAV